MTFLKSIIYILVFFQFVSIKTECDIKGSYRNIIIINGRETVARKENFFLTTKLCAALEQKVAPIIVSTAVWQNFIERKQEFSFRAAQKETREYLILNHHNEVLEKLHYWTDFFKQNSSSDAELKQLIFQQINDEFCEKLTTLRKNNLVQEKYDEELFFTFLVYLLEFNSVDWDCYRINDYYYLLIPHEYLKNISSEHHEPCYGFTSKELLLGLKIDHLEFIENPLDSSLNAFQMRQRQEYDFIDALNKLFIQKNDGVSYCTWNIYFTGHGGNDSRSFNSQKWNIIAELSVAEFRKFLLFLNDTIKTSLLFYSTCFGAGEHLRDPYMLDGESLCFNYPIILNNLSDVVSYGYGKFAVPSFLHKSKFIVDYYDYNSISGQWRLKISSKTNWKKFFKKIGNYNKDSKIEALLCNDFLECLGGVFIENIPNVRFAGADSFIIYSPNTSVKINESLVALKKYYKKSIIVDGQNSVLIETNQVPTSIKLKTKNPLPHIISSMAGEAVHYLKKIEASNYTPLDLLKAFWPLHSANFNKTFFIKKIICALDCEMSKLLELDDKEKEVTLYNVIISTERDYLVRIFFQNKSGKSFACYGRLIQKEPGIGLLVPMSEKVALAYEAYFKKIKNELMDFYKKDQGIDSFKEKLVQLKQKALSEKEVLS